MAATIDIKDLSPEQRRALNIRKRRVRGMSAHEVKSYAFHVMRVIADLTPTERARILRHADKLNKV